MGLAATFGFLVIGAVLGLVVVALVHFAFEGVDGFKKKGSK